MGSNPPEYSHFMSVCSLRAASVSTLLYLECIRGWEVKQFSGEDEGGGDGSVRSAMKPLISVWLSVRKM